MKHKTHSLVKNIFLLVALFGCTPIIAGSCSVVQPMRITLRKAMQKDAKTIGREQLLIQFFCMGLEKQWQEFTKEMEPFFCFKAIGPLGSVFCKTFDLGVSARNLCDEQGQDVYMHYKDYLKRVVVNHEQSCQLLAVFAAAQRAVKDGYWSLKDCAQLRLACMDKEMAKAATN